MQISLKEILLVVVVIAIAIPFYLSAISNNELRVENQELRDKTSSITKVEGMVNVIAIPSASSYTQSWRVLIPKNTNHTYKLAFAQSNISTGGTSRFPSLDDSEKFTASFPGISNLGEFVLSVELDENAPQIYGPSRFLVGHQTSDFWGFNAGNFIFPGKVEPVRHQRNAVFSGKPELPTNFRDGPNILENSRSD